MTLVLSAPLESQLDRLPASRRSKAQRDASRLVEETGITADEAVARALFEMDGHDERPFRRSGLRWDE